MLDVAVRLRVVDPERKIFANDAEALEWIRKAAQTAVPGSKVWYDAQFWLVGEVYHSDTAEARRILQRITDQAKGHSLTLARVEDNLKIIAIHERDFDQAERHCRRVLDWYKDPKRIPADDEEKYELDGLMRGTGGAMVNAFLLAPWPRAERARRIRALMRDSWVQALQRDGNDALQRLATPLYDDEHVLPPTWPPAKKRADPGTQALAVSPHPQGSGAVDRPSRWWLAFAGGGLVVLGGVFAWLRKRARRAAH